MGTYEDRTCVYIVMEECCGGDLETHLEVIAQHKHLILPTPDEDLMFLCHVHAVAHLVNS